ncbi:MAG: transcription antitermination factor NusB [Hyphomonadaceae bacterium]|nr:transcription antitermination factor NusB [Hyphomonadaceae bacterium]
MSAASARLDGEAIAARRAARLAAVQALYQMEMAGSSSATAVKDVLNGHLPADEDGALDGDVDSDLFRQIVETTVERQSEVDTLLAAHLARGWKLERLDAVARAILRAGLMELWRRRDVPTAVVINEYVEIAKSFFDGQEPGFVNATLDACLPAVRGGPGE